MATAADGVAAAAAAAAEAPAPEFTAWPTVFPELTLRVDMNIFARDNGMRNAHTPKRPIGITYGGRTITYSMFLMANHGMMRNKAPIRKDAKTMGGVTLSRTSKLLGPEKIAAYKLCGALMEIPCQAIVRSLEAGVNPPTPTTTTTVQCSLLMLDVAGLCSLGASKTEKSLVKNFENSFGLAGWTMRMPSSCHSALVDYVRTSFPAAPPVAKKPRTASPVIPGAAPETAAVGAAGVPAIPAHWAEYLLAGPRTLLDMVSFGADGLKPEPVGSVGASLYPLRQVTPVNRETIIKPEPESESESERIMLVSMHSSGSMHFHHVTDEESDYPGPGIVALPNICDDDMLLDEDMLPRGVIRGNKRPLDSTAAPGSVVSSL